MTDPTPAAPGLRMLVDLTGPYGDHFAFDRGGQHWALANNLAIQLGHDGTLDRKLTASEAIHDLAWSVDGKRLLAAPLAYDLAKDAWSVLPVPGNALISGLDDPPPLDQLGLGAAAYAPDGGELVVSVYVQPSRELGASDGYRGPRERVLVLGPDRALRGVLYAGDDEMRALAVSDQLIAAGGATVQVWDRASLHKLAELKHGMTARAIAFNAAGDRLGVITAAGAVSIWDPRAGTQLASFAAHPGDGYTLAFHPTQPVVATGGQDGKLQLWSLAGASLHTETLEGWVHTLAFDATGTRLGVVTRDRPPHLRIYAVTTP